MIGKFRLRTVMIPFLSLALIVSPIPGLSKIIKADEQDSPVTVPQTVQDPKKDVSFVTPPASPQELEKYRTENSKRFFNPDGSFTEKIYNKPIHYKDPATGKWLPIDSTLTLDANGTYHNKANRFSVTLPPTANGGFFGISQDGAALSFKPSFGNAAKGNSKGNHIEFVNAANDTDLTYAVESTGLKETLILKSANAPTSFSFELKLQNLTYQTQPDGTIAFLKTGDKSPLFTLAKPFMMDAKLQSSTAISYQIQQDASGNLKLDLVADPAWLKDPARAFPVLLDPTITIQNGSNTDDTLVSNANPYNNYGNWAHVYVGQSVNLGTTRSLFWFNLLGTLPSGAVISNATLNVSNTAVYVTNQAPVVEAYRITQDWTGNSVTWNNQPSIGGVDGTYTASNTTTPFTWNIDISGLVRDWYNGVQDNYGVALKYQDENLVVRELLATDDTTDPANHPSLTVNYMVDGLGTQPFWTFDGPVNVANRNLVLSAKDIDFPGRGVAVSLNRTYNSRSTSTGVFGYGWNSPLDMRIDIALGGRARLIDGNGTTHYFVQNPDGSYASPPGLYWNLYVSGSTATVTTTDYTQYTFTNGQLTKIQDAAGNALTYTRNANGQVTNIQDAAGHAINLSYYTNGLLYTATDPANRVWYYGYDTNGNLFKITAPNGSVMEYRYDSNPNMIAAIAPNNTVEYYTYTADDRIAAINPINAITNSNFEVDADGDTLPDHWSYASGYPGVHLDSTAGSSYGQAIRIDTSSANSSYWTVFVSDPIPVDPSKTYTLSGYLKATQSSGSLTTVLSLLAYDANGNPLGEIGRTALPNSFNWQRVSSTVNSTVFPAGTSKVYVKVASTNSTGSGNSWFDGVQLEEAANASDFVSGSQYTANPAGMQSARYDGEGHKHLYSYNDNQNSTKYQQNPLGLNLTDTYTWDTNIPNTLSAHQNPRGYTWSFSHDPANGNLVKVTDPKNQTNSFTWDGKANVTQYTGKNGGTYNQTYDTGSNNLTSRDPYHTSTALEHDGYGNVIKETNLLGLADNLVDNSSFELGTNPDGTPVHFSFLTGQQGMWGLSTNAVVGTHSFTIAADSANAYNYTIIQSDPISFDANSDYVLAGYLKATQTSGSQVTILSIRAVDGTGTEYEVGRMELDGTSDWTRWSTVIHPGDFPSGTATIYVKLAAKNTTGYGNSYFDAIQLQKTPVDTAYNLVDNVSFERGTTWPANWTQPPDGRWASSANPSDHVYTGTRSAAISNPLTNEGIAYSDFIPYNSTKDYNLTAFIYATGLGSTNWIANIKLEEYDANYVYLGTVTSPNQADTDWKRLSVDLKAGNAAAGTAYIRPVLTTGATSGTVYFDNVRLQEGNNTTQYSYDTSNTWVTSNTDPLGNTTSYIQDAAGNVTQETDPLGNSKAASYDNMNRLSWMKPPGNDLKVSYGYDANSNLTSITNTDPTGATTYNQTQIAYNPTDQVSSLTDPLGRQTVYSYFPSRRLKEIKIPSNDRLSFAYDKANRLTDVYFNGVTYSAGMGRYHYGYDPNSNITSVQDLAQGRTWTATYDELDQLASWGDGTGTISYTPDAEGNVTQKQLKNSAGTVLKTENATYNKINQPSSFTDGDGKTSKFLFNENRQLSMLQSGNLVTERLGYDKAGHLTQVQNQTNTGSVISSYKYVPDANGRISSITDQTGQTLNYTYTAKGQLYTETLPSGNTVTYSYDPLGNRTQREEKTPGGGVVKTTTYGYDATKTQLTQVDGVTWSYDGNGNVSSNGTYNFKWDVAGRLTEVDKVSDGSVIATYLYDDIGRRIQQTVNGQVTKFLYDGKSNRVLAEYDGSGNLTQYYTWSPNGMLLSLTVNGTTYYTVRNGHGDIVQLTDVNGNTKDANGNVYASYTYDAWGNLLSQTGTVASLNPYRYAGYRYDDATGLYYLTARYYDPSVGRFLSVDPESITSDYTYAGNNPLSYIDPNGHWIFDVAFLVYDVVSFIANPTWVGAAWIAVDLVSTAIPTGSISLAARAARVIDEAAHAAEMARVVGEGTRIAAKGASEGAHAGAGIGAVVREGKSFISGKEGEQYLADLVGGTPQVYKRTSRGGRYIDQLSANNIAHESKVGYTTLTSRIKTQVLKDAELIQTEEIKGAEWHFFRSAVTGKIGASASLQNFLKKSGLKFTIHD